MVVDIVVTIGCVIALVGIVLVGIVLVARVRYHGDDVANDE